MFLTMFRLSANRIFFLLRTLYVFYVIFFFFFVSVESRHERKDHAYRIFYSIRRYVDKKFDAMYDYYNCINHPRNSPGELSSQTYVSLTISRNVSEKKKRESGCRETEYFTCVHRIRVFDKPLRKIWLYVIVIRDFVGLSANNIEVWKKVTQKKKTNKFCLFFFFICSKFDIFSITSIKTTFFKYNKRNYDPAGM